MARTCECDKNIREYEGRILDQLKNYYLVKEDSDSWSQSHNEIVGSQNIAWNEGMIMEVVGM